MFWFNVDIESFFSMNTCFITDSRLIIKIMLATSTETRFPFNWRHHRMWTLFEICLNTVDTSNKFPRPYRRAVKQMPQGKRGCYASATETTETIGL
jgi:hypothetical protein